MVKKLLPDSYKLEKICSKITLLFFSRIWEQIINKSVDNLKKTEFQLLIEEQKAQKERLANIESALKAIEANLINKTDKK